MHHDVQTRRRRRSRPQLQQTLRSMQCDSREFSLCVGHVERERASIITSTDIEIEREHSLLIDHSFSASTTDTWYIDSGASSHMTGAREMFFELSQAETNVEVVLGDDSTVRAVGRGTITFQRESMSPMVLRDVLYGTWVEEELGFSFHD